MPQSHYQEILDKIQSLQAQLEHEFDQLLSQKRADFKYQLRKRRVIFDKGIRDLHRKYKVGIWPYLKGTNPLFIITAPIIYGVIIPLIILDAAVFIYQQVCFRVYGIPIVLRSQYIILDRHNLSYLNSIEKFNCLYCGYGNGLIEYIREVFARTEQYWCPIKHARRANKTHSYVEKFVDYGDADNYKKKLKELREELKNKH